MFIVGDYNSLGIPKAPPSRPKSPPARPSPPVRPPLPTTPKHTPKAGVISIVKTEQGILRPVSADSSGTASPSMPHRPAPPVIASKTYQEPEQQPNLSRKSSSSSSTSSPIQEAPQKVSPPQSLSIHDQDTGAIYEEIDDDVVSNPYIWNTESHYYKHLIIFTVHSKTERSSTAIATNIATGFSL